MMMNDQEMTAKEKRSSLETVYWGVVLLWAGVVFGAESLGYLPQIGEADAWSWAFAGAGLFGLLGAFYRLSSPNLPNPSTWDYLWSGGLTILGLVGFTSLDIGFPLILLLVGAVILVSTLVRRN